MISRSFYDAGSCVSVIARLFYDMGSCISAIARSFYDTKLNEVQLQPIRPYEGYIEVELKITIGLHDVKPLYCLFVFSLDAKYSVKKLVIIGTNILTELIKDCKNKFGEQYLQKANLHTPWFLSFRCIALRENE